MSVTYTIKGTSVEFPTSGTSANWAPAVNQWAKLVTDAINATGGTFDVAATKYTMLANANTNVDLTVAGINFAFPPAAVRAVFIKYSVFRSTDSTTVSESGTIYLLYDGTTWQQSRDYLGDASVTFDVAAGSSGQVQFSSTAIAGTGHTGFISYIASAIEQ